MAAGLALAALCVSCGGASTPHLPFGAYAGYGWLGPVSSISGSWTVPAIGSDSPAGNAGTWIGAEQNTLVPVVPFIQVGTNEEEDVGPEYPRPLVQYYAFWTDTVHGFVPVRLFTVQPRDRVSARLVLAAGRWHVSIEDARSGRSATLSTRDEATSSFGLAIWSQEDVTVQTRPRRLASYPHLSAIRFDHLTVNGKPLNACCVFAAWMSLGSAVLRPTALHQGSFALRLERPRLTAVQRRYLEIFARPGDPIDPAESELAAATADGSRSSLRHAADAFERGLRRQIAELRAGRWPVAARESIDDFVDALTALLTATKATEEIRTTGFPAWRAAWLRATSGTQPPAAAALRALGVPELEG